MQTEPSMSTGPVVQLPVMLVAEVQDSLMVVMHDLSRLESLLSHTMDNLMARFNSVNQGLDAVALPDVPAVDDVRSNLRAAVTELQFQDMASQLIVHTTLMLQGCAFRLASESMGQEDGEEAAPFGAMVPDRPNPVTQSEMDAGSIELF
ncbi:hypothetical protein J2X19_004219 [Rhodoferax ferrireducens]|uniref:Uncharacterized protein n=1 Tax=Rhodoferax ferrireducens TaxID=192843 RepID=A0ABU2CDY0_9BURK|nr:hypothetical protein [Rhodoferax ferrireducens]MDR7379523.1 hypothetical protein [Rhodoferax ferrireducens]